MIKQFRTKRTILKLLVVALVIGCAHSLISPHHASALVPTDISWWARSAISDYEWNPASQCNSGVNLYGFTLWLSQGGVPMNDGPITVPYGTTDIPLQFNSVMFICHRLANIDARAYPGLPNDGTPNGAVALSQADIYISNVSSPNGVILGNPAGLTNVIPYQGGTRYWFGTVDPAGFTLRTPPLTSTQVVWASVTTMATNIYRGTVYVCVADGSIANKNNPPTYSCPPYTITIPILVNVQPKPTPFNASPGASATITGGTVDNPTKVTFGATATSTAPTTPTIRLFRTFTKNGATYPPTPANATNDVVANSSGAPAPNVDMLISGAAVGDRYCTTVMANPDSGNFYSDGTQSPGPGGGGWTPPVTACVTVAAAPYFKVYGGDVSAGGSFDAGSCTQDPSAGVLSWNLNGAPNYGGSGTEFAAQAMANISGFATAQASNTGDGLSFANSVNNVPASGQFGGQLGAGGIPCAYDYYGKQPGTATSLAAKLACMTAKIPGSVPATSTPSLSNAGTCDTRINNLVTSGSVYSVDVSSSGGLWISGTGPPLNPGQDFTMYVKGNVYITNNITYNPNGWSMGRVPSFRLIAQGNIYVDSSVTQLDGLYVAQPDAVGGGGTIYDCAGGPNKLFVSQPVDVTFYAKCGGGGQPLVVNGAFIANTTKLWRTTGTYSQSGTDSQGAGACDSPGSCGTKAGEVFNYSPELWLTQAATTQTRYDTVTSLPPIL